MKKLLIEKLVVKIKKDSKIKRRNGQGELECLFSREISLGFDNIGIKFMKYQKEIKVEVNVRSIGLNYFD